MTSKIDVQAASIGRGGQWNLRDLVDLLWTCARLSFAPETASPLAARVLELLTTGLPLPSVTTAEQQTDPQDRG